MKGADISIDLGLNKQVEPQQYNPQLRNEINEMRDRDDSMHNDAMTNDVDVLWPSSRPAPKETNQNANSFLRNNHQDEMHFSPKVQEDDVSVIWPSKGQGAAGGLSNLNTNAGSMNQASALLDQSNMSAYKMAPQSQNNQSNYASTLGSLPM